MWNRYTTHFSSG